LAKYFPALNVPPVKRASSQPAKRTEDEEK
jgi:hypothetical protein